jgi:hypothetical protein
MRHPNARVSILSIAEDICVFDVLNIVAAP